MKDFWTIASHLSFPEDFEKYGIKAGAAVEPQSNNLAVRPILARRSMTMPPQRRSSPRTLTNSGSLRTQNMSPRSLPSLMNMPENGQFPPSRRLLRITSVAMNGRWAR
ncbi:MAG: hypothetical protein ACLVGR_03000 [Anaerovoracaceae bacterium]